MYRWHQGGRQQIEQQPWNSLPSFFPATSAQGAAPPPHPPTPAKVSSVHQVTSAWRGRSLRKAVQSERISPITDSPTAQCARLVSCALMSTWRLPTRAWRVSCISVSKWMYCCRGLILVFQFCFVFVFTHFLLFLLKKIEDVPDLICICFCYFLCFFNWRCTSFNICIFLPFTVFWWSVFHPDTSVPVDWA